MRARTKKIALRILVTFAVAITCFLAFAYWYDSRGQRPDPTFNSSVEHPAYTGTGPEILFDEAHQNFHTTRSGYKPFADLMRNDGYSVQANQSPFSASTLAGVSTLVIVNALGPDGHETRSAFTDSECAAIAEWVANGGSLLLVADHSPFGSAAKKLAETLGVKMFVRFARDDQNSDGDNERLVFSRSNGLLAEHPITEGRNPSEQLNRVVTFTGQSLTGPPGSVPFLKLDDNAYDWESRKVRYPARGHAQGMAFHFGKGRVVVLGEAAVLTAQVDPLGFKFGMNRAGSDDRQLALNIMHWLSGLLPG
jgi:Domain of unknown function (DUF4350)